MLLSCTCPRRPSVGKRSTPPLSEEVLRIRIADFDLVDLTDEAYLQMCGEPAPIFFSQVPGLISKAWLANEETNACGGVHTWERAEAMAAFLDSELFEQFTGNPHFANQKTTDFGGLANPSRLTRGTVPAAA